MTKHPSPPPRSPGPVAIGVLVLAVLGLRLVWIGFYGTSNPAGSPAPPRKQATSLPKRIP